VLVTDNVGLFSHLSSVSTSVSCRDRPSVVVTADDSAKMADNMDTH